MWYIKSFCLIAKLLSFIYYNLLFTELVPAECMEVLNTLCCHILSTSAFMHWDTSELVS